MLDCWANTGRLGPWAMAVAFAVMVGLSGRAVAAEWADFPPTSFKIYSQEGGGLLGTSRYFVEHLGPGEYRLHGNNHYLNGQYDIELDTLVIDPGERVPRLKSFSHVFYKPDGTILVAGHAEIKSGGEAVCVANEQGKEVRYAQQFDFPPDTYAGAAVLIPIIHALRKGVTAPFEMHFFDCTPKPRIVTIQATPTSAGTGWLHYPEGQGHLIEVQIKPDLGWLDLLAAPFLPVTHSWFNPAEGFTYVGGGINRYFYSPQHVTMVKVKPGQELAAPGGPRVASAAPSPGVGSDDAGRAPTPSATPQQPQAALPGGR